MSRDITESTKSTQSDQSLCVRMKKPWVLSYPLSAQQRLIRLGRWPGWSVFAGCTLTLLVLLCRSSNALIPETTHFVAAAASVAERLRMLIFSSLNRSSSLWVRDQLGSLVRQAKFCLQVGSPILPHFRPKKIICVFQVSRPYLGFCPDPKHFIVNCEQNIVKYARKCAKMLKKKMQYPY